jgi:FkbM family methyltransferase
MSIWRGVNNQMTPVDVYRIRGLSFQVRDGTLDAEIIRDVVENNHYASLLDQIEPRCICIDVGAHIGAFAILAASRGARVYAFEPIPVNYELLLENIQLNGLSDQITAYNQAVWSHDTVKMITFSEENAGAGGLVWPGNPGVIQVSCVGLRNVKESLIVVALNWIVKVLNSRFWDLWHYKICSVLMLSRWSITVYLVVCLP